MKNKVIALALAILAFFFFVGSPFQQAANAVVGVDDALIVVIIAALAAMGITFGTTGAFNNLKDYVSSLLSDYATSRGLTVSQLLSGCQTGTNSLGQILINNRFVRLIDGFGAFIKATLSLSNNQTLSLQQSGYYMSNIELVKLPWTGNASTSYYDFATVVYTVLGDYPVFLINCDYTYLLISNRPATVRKVMTLYEKNGQIVRQDEEYYELSKNNVTANNVTIYFSETQYYGCFMSVTEMYNWPTASYNYYDVANAVNSNTYIQDQDGMFLVTDIITLPSDDSNYQEGDGAVIDVGGSWGDSWNDVIDDVVGDFSDNEEGVTEGEAEIFYEGEETIQDQVEDTPAQSQPISQEVGDYQVTGLQSVFPFCIPFDIYSFFSCLAAEPVAPSFEWRFYVPGICDETIELDLSQFDNVAQIVRTMELLAFIVGLAFVTRDKMIKG